MTTPNPKCSEVVWRPLGRWGSSGPCTRTGVVERDGKWYCRQHDPEEVTARQRVATEKESAEAALKAATRAGAEELCRGLGTGRPHYDALRNGYTGGVALGAEEAQTLLQRLAGGAPAPGLLRVTVRCTVATRCPNGGADETEVAVTWAPVRHVNAEAVHALVERYAGATIWCEELALAVAASARPLVGAPVRVVARQLVGHGVEAEAEA